MFYASAKNPLESETLGERRERKARESDGSVVSSRSSSSVGDSKSIKSLKSSILGALSKSSSKPQIQTPEPPLKITVTQSVDVAAAELHDSAQQPLVPSTIYAGPCASTSSARGCSELSASPALIRPTTQKSLSYPRQDDLKLFNRNRRRMSLIDEASTIPQDDCKSEPTVSMTVVRPQNLLKDDKVTRERKLLESQRPQIFRNVSERSTCSTSSSDTLGQFHGENTAISPIQGKDPKVDSVVDILPSPISAPEVHQINLSPPPYLVTPERVSAIETTEGVWRENCSVKAAAAPAAPYDASRQINLRVMDNSSTQILIQRLSEDWEGTESEVKRHMDFEMRLWAIKALERIGQDFGSNEGATLPKDVTINKEEGPQNKTVMICDVGAEAWQLAMSKPQQSVICLSSIGAQDHQTAQMRCLSNLDVQGWQNSPSLPFDDSTIDLISSRLAASLLRSHDWPLFLRECSRTLKPGGKLEITVLDPMPENAGQLLAQWTNNYLVLGLERKFLATRPAMVLPFWLNDTPEFTSVDIKRISFLAGSGHAVDPADTVSQDFRSANGQHILTGTDQIQANDVEELQTALGRHFYQALYRDFVPETRPKRPTSVVIENANDIVRQWWWRNPAIVNECRENGTKFDMVTFTCSKRSTSS